jgi:hypothetical protein
VRHSFFEQVSCHSGLCLKYSSITLFQDADILWFRNPFPSFDTNADFQIACDRYNGQPFNIHKNLPNGGFVYVRSNRRTIAMYRYWYEARLRHPGKHDQDVLNLIFREKAFHRLRVSIRFLDTDYFSGFCQVSPPFSSKTLITYFVDYLDGVLGSFTHY